MAGLLAGLIAAAAFGFNRFRDPEVPLQ